MLLKVDFPRRTPLPANIKAQNDALAQQFGIRAFPTFLILPSQGTLIGEVNRGAMRSPEQFVAQTRQVTPTNTAALGSFGDGDFEELFEDSFFLIFVLVSIISFLWLLVLAFKTSFLWGLGTLFIPFVYLIFIFSHWERVKIPGILNLILTGLSIYFALTGALDILEK